MGTSLAVFFKDIALYLIYIAAIITFFLSFSGKIKYGFIFLIFLLPEQNIFIKLQQLPFGKDIPNLLLLAMTLGWFFNKIFKNQQIFGKSSLNIILILYCFYTYYTLWHGTFYFDLPAPLSIVEPRFQAWKNYMVFPLLFLIGFNNLNDKKELVRLFVFICLTMVLMDHSTLTEIKYATSWFSRTKFHSTFQWLGANEVAAFYASYTAVLIGVFLFIKRWFWKILLGILILVNLYCITFLFSRGEYLAILGTFFLIGLFRQKILLVIVILVLLFWQVILPQKVIERIKYTEEDGQMDQSAEKRLEYWQESMEHFKQSPIVGIGFNTKTYIGSQRDTHNLYIRTLAEQGIIGLLFLLSIWGIAFSRAIRLFKRANDEFFKGLGLGFAACIVAIMIGNLFGDRWTYLPLGAYFWIFLAMVERGNLIIDRELKT